MTDKNTQQLKRKRRIRAKIVGSKDKPRLSIFRSNKQVSAQLIDDVNGKTLLTLTQKHIDINITTKGKTDAAHKLGLSIAQKAKDMKVKQVIFDKRQYAYHGRVKALAEGAREGGLKF